jgi:hypothetical protein
MKASQQIPLALLSLGLFHCAPKVGVIGPGGFEQARYEYRLAYRDPSQKQFLGPDWQLDNYYMDPAWHELKPKQGPDYVAVREFDQNGDGVISAYEKNEEPIYDLRFVNAQDDGVIWLKAHPVARVDSRRDLEVVLNNYADGLAGTGLYAQGNLFSIERAKQRQFTTFVTAKEPVKVGPLTGLAGLIEIAEVEKLRLDPQYRSEKVKVVFLRFGYCEQSDLNVGPIDNATPVTRNGHTCYRRPALFIAGYANTVARFDSHLKDFDQALGQLSFPSDSVIAAEGTSPEAARVQSPDAGK